MTHREMTEAVRRGSRVTYRGGAYKATGIIARFGRQPNMAQTVPDGWWYQAELTEMRTGTLMIAGIEDVMEEQKR